MRFTSIDIQHVRNLESLSFEPAPSINFFCGPNGAGKSSILEAIYLLSSGRSFRTHLTRELISDQSDQLLVRAAFTGSTSTVHQAGILKKKSDSLRLRLNQSDLKSAAELARLLPVTVIHPDMHELVKGGPSVRRKFIDWGLFHVEPSFHSVWKRYQFALLQRNNLLKGTFSQTELQAWTQELVDAGIQLDQTRKQYVNQLRSVFQKWSEIFSLGRIADVEYRPGWDQNKRLADAFKDGLKNCIRYKTTTTGPHRADLTIRFGETPAKKVVSRGQQKLIVYALVFSQIELYQMLTGQIAVLLCDDPEAELDKLHRKILIDSVRRFDVQCFISGNSRETWPVQGLDKMFHVEQGQIKLV